MKPSEITDDVRLTGAVNQWGSAIPFYDDGSGTVFVFRESMGVSGIVRADTWETAWKIAMDEFTSEASDTVADFEREYGPEWWENELWCDAHGFRPSGGGVYARDLNGESLDVLTDADAEEMGITITVEPWWTGAQGSVKPDSGPARVAQFVNAFYCDAMAWARETASTLGGVFAGFVFPH